MKNLINGILLLALGQSLVWFQTNGQFIWPLFKRNPAIVALIGGSIVSYTFILGTKELAEYYGISLGENSVARVASVAHEPDDPATVFDS